MQQLLHLLCESCKECKIYSLWLQKIIPAPLVHMYVGYLVVSVVLTDSDRIGAFGKVGE